MQTPSGTSTAPRSLKPWLVTCAGLCWLLFTVIPLLDEGEDPQYAGERVDPMPVGLARAVAEWLWGGAWTQGPDGFLVRTLLVLVPFALMLAAYGLLLRAAARGGTVSLRALLGATVLASAPLVLSDLLLSRDLYSYILYGRMQVLYGGNPYVNVPMDHPDPFLLYASSSWRYVPSAYGPLWNLLSIPITWVAEGLGGSMAVYLLVYKAVQAGVHLGNVVLIHGITRRLRPGWETFAAVAFGFNPLMLGESAWNGHNDPVLLLCLLGGLAAYQRGRPRLGLLLLVLSVFVKWVTLVVLPLYLLLLLRQARSRREQLGWVGGAAALGLAVAVLTFAPYWRGPDTLLEMRQQVFLKFMHNSLADTIQSELRRARFARGQGSNPDLDVIRTMAPVIAGYEQTGKMDWSLAPPPEMPLLQELLRLVGRALLVLVWLWWLPRVRDLGSLLRATGWSFFAFIVFTSVWVWPWYLIWLLGVACMAGSPRLLRVSVLLSFTGWLIYFGKAHYLGELGERYRGLLTFGPALLYLAFSAWGSWRRAEERTAPEAKGAGLSLGA
jgi:hypothetical protein